MGLRLRSSYFRAMFSGAWAETHSIVTTNARDVAKDGSVVINVQWPHDQLARLLQFLHGGNFVEEFSDLRAAVDCAAFFGVPSLLMHAREWIVENLRIDTASRLWHQVEAEPL